MQGEELAHREEAWRCPGPFWGFQTHLPKHPLQLSVQLDLALGPRLPSSNPSPTCSSRLFLSLELGSEGSSGTDRLRLMTGGRSMATPGEPCAGLRVSPICSVPFSGPELQGKAVADFKFLTSGSNTASERRCDRSGPFQRTQALAEPLGIWLFA